jgi:drug/metabolite transporter (DMT)-like permease
MNKKTLGIIFAILAAVLYSVSTPLSKLLMNTIEPVFMASFLYLGAGIGISILYLFHFKKEPKNQKLSKSDTPYVIAMTVLDIIAPILMMTGIHLGSSSSSSLLNNFEIVATSLIALLLFKEVICKYLWIGIGLITIASFILSFPFQEGFTFSIGSILVLLATLCWGLENNCTRKLSQKSTYQIVMVKGLGSGLSSFIIALILKEQLPELKYIAYTLILGFIAYGLSIFVYVRAQKILGAAKTSAFYAIAPFIGSFLAFVIVHEQINLNYWIALAIMIGGVIFVAFDTLKKEKTTIDEFNPTKKGEKI